MVVEKKSGDFKTVEIHLPSWMYSKVALAVMAAVIIIGFVYMTPGLNTAVFGTNAKTSQDAQTEVKNPNVQQSAENAAVNAVTAETGSYVPKYNVGGANIQEAALNNLPEKLLISIGGAVYMKNLKVEGNYLYGDLESTVDITGENVRVAFIDKNGQQIVEAGVSGLLYGGYEYGPGSKKLNIYEEHPTGPINLKKGVGQYFRVLLPQKAVYIQTIR